MKAKHFWLLVSLIVLLICLIAPLALPLNAQRGDSPDGADEGAGLCPVIVEAALIAAGEACTGIGRNVACYGNVSVTATSVTAVLDDFDTPGDLTALAELTSLHTAPLDEAAGTWGIALLSVQADLPDTLPGQNVTFILLGDAAITADPAASPDFDAPMQAFRLYTNFGQPQCLELPPDGLVVQAPRDTTVNFLVNGVEVSVGSTAFLSLVDGGALEISTLAGSVGVTAQAESVTIEPGNWAKIPENAPPGDPIPYAYDHVRSLPVDLLPEEVNIPISVRPVFDWLDSGREIVAGETFTLRATGTVNLWVECEAQREAGDIDPETDCEQASIYGPDGANHVVTQEDQDRRRYPFPGQMIGALMARIGDNGEPFFVGSGGTFTAETDGTLQFFINDDPVPDNAGGYIVILTRDEATG